ncbi:MAG: tetratricopeptide repeat protein [Deltaproteobacteria bacterium]|nr:tetratricopeptide repeat protein [Deltaproteobacteria bacterium]
MSKDPSPVEKMTVSEPERTPIAQRITAAQEVERRRRLVAAAEKVKGEGLLEEAESLLQQALEADPKHPGTHERLAEVWLAMGRTAQAAQGRQLAETLRKEAWQRQVEAEIRGQHEVLKDL